MVWPSSVTSQFQSDDININPLDFSITKYDVYMIDSLYPIGCIISPFICARLIDLIGRKNTMLVTGIINLVFFVVLAYSTTMLSMWMARLVIGICTGSSTIAVVIFISEISEDHNRGKIGCFLTLFLPLGQIYGHVMGSQFSARIFTLTCMIPLAIHVLLLLYFIPDTPVYLVYKEKRILAVKSLKRYGGKPSRVKTEKNIEKNEFNIEETTKGHQGGLLSILCHQPSRRGFIVGLGMFLIKCVTGTVVSMPLTGPIFENSQIGISGNLIPIFVALLKISSTFILFLVVEKIGRKPFMLGSTIMCSVSLFFLGLHFLMREQNYSLLSECFWLPFASMIIFIIAYSFGADPIPTATIGELFASNVRTTAVSTIILFSRSFEISFLLLYPIVVKYIGDYGCLWFFCGFSAFGAAFIYLFMPETKGKSVYEIQRLLKGKPNYCDNDPM